MRSFKKFLKRQRLKIFRTAVNYRRFVVKTTRIKRRRFVRQKRHTNRLAISNVLSYWIENYQFSKQLARFQTFNKMFSVSCILFSFNYVRANKLRVYPENLPLVSSALTRTAFLASYRVEKKTILNSFFSANYVQASFETPLSFEVNTSGLLILYTYDNQFFGELNDCETEQEDFLNLCFLLSLTTVSEIYKILTLLVFLKLSAN